MAKRRITEEKDFLFECILSLSTVEECYGFFEDLCTPKEIEILYMLASNPGQVFTREQLLNRVWGYDFAGETRTVDTHIKRIRAKLDNTGLNWSIKTIYGVGYKFEVE